MRESLFATLGDAFEGRKVLDLFSGVGSFGLEALSRGARGAVFVDRSRASLDILRKNIESLGFGPRCEVLHGDALRVPDLLLREERAFALIFLDPPFTMFDRLEDAERVFGRVQEILQSAAVEQDAILLLRHPSKFQGDCPIPAEEKRTYGESVLLRFSPGEKRAG